MRIRIIILLLTAPLCVRAATFTVINNNDSGPGSLRQAIQEANTNAGMNTINFGISGPPYTIYLASSLPLITNSVIINGYNGSASQNSLPDDDNATPNIEITSSYSGVAGLFINASNCTVEGLVMNGLTTCISLTGPGGDVIAGNFLGVSPDGSNASPRTVGTGIFVNTAGATNLIGGPTPAARNLISGMSTVAIDLRGTSVSMIEGNFIGTDRHGTSVIPTVNGISILSQGNRIGGTTVAQRNIISGIGTTALDIRAAGNLVQGNFIGTDVSGRFALNNYSGVASSGAFDLIGGPALIPGSPPGNVISGNYFPLQGDGGSNVIQGNVIGLDVTGTNRIGNNSDGIRVSATHARIGGTNAGEGNVISGNGGSGIQFSSSAGNNAVIQGNWIGTDVSGTLNLSNGIYGILISGPRNVTVGGDAPNVIAFNGYSGVAVLTSGATNNFISANAIYGNKLLGIDLIGASGYGAPNLNSSCNSDTAGPNQLQNYPVLTNVTSTTGNTTIQGYMPGAPSTSYRLEFFANDSLDPSGFGEGQIYLGFLNLAASANCTNLFSVTLPVGYLGGKAICATATDQNNNTSEFSACFTATGVGTLTAPTLSVVLTVSNTVLVSWPYPPTGWNLRQNGDLNTTNWVTPSETVNNDGTNNFIIVNPPTGNQFYRLFKP